jgi:adenosylcobyric acid synthase
MVCGTSSDAGKSHLVAGLCRVLARQGVRVAPFKGQNMSLNSAVTGEGHEIGRAQEVQARAAGVEPEAAMNPVLLKPTGDRSSQVVVLGRPTATMDALAFQDHKAELLDVVTDALASLRRRFDVVVCEGAGSPAEINLLRNDLVNLGLAQRAGIPAVVVGDIERGGVLAHLYGTVALLPEELRKLVKGFVVNKFRGDPTLLGAAFAELQRRSGVPTLGVLPFLPGVHLDAEDSLALAPGPGGDGSRAAPGTAPALSVAVVRFPRLSNFTDVDPLGLEPAVSVRFVGGPADLGDPDLVVLPGTKATVADLRWAREIGLVAALDRLRAGPRPPVVLGLCGGYQMLGTELRDPLGVESDEPHSAGLGWLPATTTFAPAKRTERRRGTELATGTAVEGYEIHHGTTVADEGADPWLAFGAEAEGCRDEAAGVYGTSLHGLFERDEFRTGFLGRVARRRGRRWESSGLSFAAAREGQIDRLADACEAHLNLAALWSIVEEGRLR